MHAGPESPPSRRAVRWCCLAPRGRCRLSLGARRPGGQRVGAACGLLGRCRLSLRARRPGGQRVGASCGLRVILAYKPNAVRRGTRPKQTRYPLDRARGLTAFGLHGRLPTVRTSREAWGPTATKCRQLRACHRLRLALPFDLVPDLARTPAHENPPKFPSALAIAAIDARF